MSSPYRDPDAQAVPQARVLTGANRTRIAAHVAVTAGLGGLAGWLMWLALNGGTQAAAVVIALASVPVIYDLARSIHEAFMEHRVLADSRGLEFTWPKKRAWLPLMRRHSETVAWDDLLNLQTRTTQSGSSTTSTLIVYRRGVPPVFEIPDGCFALDAQRLQQLILDERDDRFVAPQRSEANIPAFNAARFAEPVHFMLKANRGQQIGGAVFGLCMAAAGIAMAYVIPGQVDLVFTLPCLVTGAAVAWVTNTPASAVQLRLDAQGLHYAKRAGQFRTLRWEQIRFARSTVVNGSVESLRVATNQGDDLILRGDYGVPLVELALMISPSVEMVMAARGAVPHQAGPAAEA